MKKYSLSLLAGVFVLLSQIAFSQKTSNPSFKKSSNMEKSNTIGSISNNLTPVNENAVCFVDKFFVPKNSIEEFIKQMKINRAFIANLSGYIRGEAIEKTDSEGNKTIITIAIWENQDKLDKARQSIQTAFKRNGFNPAEFYQRLNIKMERDIYSRLKE
jgi:heme-degrading monooxygenase HmoA